MVSSEYYDVIIIGSGPGGGTMAWQLAQTGKRILLLERGDYLPRERENWETKAVFRTRVSDHGNLVRAEGKAFHPGLHYFVGGNSKVYGGVLLRLREDFDEIGHPEGISPAWPVKYDTFEPYYQARRSSITSTACAAKIPPSRAPPSPTPIRRFARAAHPELFDEHEAGRPPSLSSARRHSAG